MSREALRSMVDHLVKDDKDAAALDFKEYTQSKMQDIAGINTPVTSEEPDDGETVEQMLADLEASSETGE